MHLQDAMHSNKCECLKYEEKYTDQFHLGNDGAFQRIYFYKHRKVTCLGPHKQHQSNESINRWKCMAEHSYQYKLLLQQSE